MPRVLDPASKIIFCEGRPGSLDDLLLRYLMPGRIFIQPVGGKRGMRAFIEGYLGGYPGSKPEYLGFRDRDFDIEPPERPQLIRLQEEKPIWLSHCAAIENYLIDADLLWQYWVERESTPGWAHGPALSATEIEDHIRESARELADYQAVRWALARLKPGDRWPEVSTTWTRGSGFIPSSLDYDGCLAQARRLVMSFQEQIQLIMMDSVVETSKFRLGAKIRALWGILRPGFSKNNLKTGKFLCFSPRPQKTSEPEIQDVHPGCLPEYAEAYRGRFNDRRFLENRGYLTWFHGKDHLVQLCRRLAPNFPRWPYANWAAEHVDVRKHPDLQQLIALAG